MMMPIDVHSHTVPRIYLDALQASAVRDTAGFPIPEWSLQGHLKAVDENKIQACVLSISSPGLRFVDNDVAMNLARAVNIEHAESIANYPSRFGGFALLPMPNIEASLKEIEYALEAWSLGLEQFSKSDAAIAKEIPPTEQFYPDAGRYSVLLGSVQSVTRNAPVGSGSSDE